MHHHIIYLIPQLFGLYTAAPSCQRDGKSAISDKECVILSVLILEGGEGINFDNLENKTKSPKTNMLAGNTRGLKQQN